MYRTENTHSQVLKWSILAMTLYLKLKLHKIQYHLYYAVMYLIVYSLVSKKN